MFLNRYNKQIQKICNFQFLILGNQSDLIPENVIVNLDDFKQASSNFVPSISKKDLEYFNKLKSNFSP